jgi:hypothetical protein
MRCRSALIISLAIVCAAAPAASASPALDQVAQQPRQDLRSPDARDAASTARPAQDLRSPDARDAAAPNARPTRDAAAPKTTPTLAVTEPAGGSGFEWSSALVGAAIILGLFMLQFAGRSTVAVRRRARQA